MVWTAGQDVASVAADECVSVLSTAISGGDFADIVDDLGSPTLSVKKRFLTLTDLESVGDDIAISFLPAAKGQQMLEAREGLRRDEFAVGLTVETYAQASDDADDITYLENLCHLSQQIADLFDSRRLTSMDAVQQETLIEARYDLAALYSEPGNVFLSYRLLIFKAKLQF